MTDFDERKHRRSRDGRFAQKPTPASAATVASSAENAAAYEALAGDYELSDGVAGKPGPIPGSSLPEDDNGWFRHEIGCDVAGTSTGDYSLAWEYTATYENARTGRVVEFIYYPETTDTNASLNDTLPSIDTVAVMERQGIGERDADGEVDINDYLYEIQYQSRDSLAGYDDYARELALSDSRSILGDIYDDT